MGQKPINEEFEELPFEEQCKRVYETPIAKKGDLIVRSQDPVRIVQSLSCEELYLTVREMDDVNIPELIQHANIGQLQFMSDFECWTDDMISKRGFIQWLKYLEEAGDEKLYEWLATADFEMLIAGFNKYIAVLKPDHEERVDDVIGDRAYFTLDGFYYIMIDEDNMETIKRAVSVLFDQEKHLYYNLLEGIMSEVDAFVEEEALQSRVIRLSEKGFPAKEEARRIYRIITEEEWQKYSKREGVLPIPERASEPLPLYPAVWRDEKLFLDDVFAALADVPVEETRAIYQELVWLSNKILMVEGVDEFNEKKVVKAFNQARHVLNCALEDLGEGDVMKARRILRESWVEYIFRWGFSSLYRLRSRAEAAIRLHWEYSLDKAFDFFDEPYGTIMRGLLQSHPRMYDPECKDSLYALRDFRSIADIYEIDKELDTFTTLCALLSTRTFIGWDTFIQEYESVSQLDASDVRMSTFIMTLFAHFVLRKNLQIKTLQKKEIMLFIKKVFSGAYGEPEREFKKELTAGFIAAFFDALNGVSRDEFNSLKVFFDRCFQSGEEELGMLNLEQETDIRFIRTLLTTAPREAEERTSGEE
jgi:hypothetical protein